jgi:hypothetical protein
MNAVNRLLAMTTVAAVSAASVAELWPQLGPQADLWKVPSYLRQISSLFDEADTMDSQYALLSHLRNARERVIEALLQNRLTASQAVDSFRELDAIRSESGLADAPERGRESPSEKARLAVLSYLGEVAKTTPSSQDNAALNQVIRELNVPTAGSGCPSRLQ